MDFELNSLENLNCGFLLFLSFLSLLIDSLSLFSNIDFEASSKELELNLTNMAN